MNVSTAGAAVSMLPLRLKPGDDLRAALESALRMHGGEAAFVLSGIGSLAQTRLRLAGADKAVTIGGDVEILSLGGSIAVNGAHLHASVADAQGRVVGGHVAPGCIVRTTAELLLAVLPGWCFSRAADPASGYAELSLRPRPAD